MAKTLEFDIDGTICPQLVGDNVDYSSLKPFPEAVATINRLYDEGNRIRIRTSRYMGRFKGDAQAAHEYGYERTLKQLQSWGLKFHELQMGKPRADKYIDDKGVFFQPDWEKIYEECTCA